MNSRLDQSKQPQWSPISSFSFNLLNAGIKEHAIVRLVLIVRIRALAGDSGDGGGGGGVPRLGAFAGAVPPATALPFLGGDGVLLFFEVSPEDRELVAESGEGFRALVKAGGG